MIVVGERFDQTMTVAFEIEGTPPWHLPVKPSNPGLSSSRKDGFQSYGSALGSGSGGGCCQDSGPQPA